MTGPVEDRTSVLPCTCLAVLKEDKSALRCFVANLRKDPWTPCPCPCPFSTVKAYYDLCPDKNGSERIAENEAIIGVTAPRLEDLRFWRSVNFCKDAQLRQYNSLPLGKNNSLITIHVIIVSLL